MMVRRVICVGLLSLASFGADFAQGEISESKHDLTTNTSIVGGFGICSFCHGPHTEAETVAPMWERSDSQATFTLYESSTIISAVEQPGINSLICMSCHDGMTAFDALNGSTGTLNNDMEHLYPGSPAIISSNLTDDHPIGVSATANPLEIKSPTAIAGAGLLLFDGRVECATCHDAHGESGYPYFLRVDNEGSNLCLGCHIK